MFDLWVRDTEVTGLLALTAVLVVLPFQLWLCFKAKKRLIKFLPAIIFTLSALAFYAMAFIVKDWSAVFYVILAVFSCVFLLSSGVAWGIWAVISNIKKNR